MNHERQLRDDGVVKILAALFKRMCDADSDFDNPADRLAAQPGYYIGWLQRTIDDVNGPELAAELGVPAASWDFVHHIVTSGTFAPIVAVWPRIILADRPKPKNVLAGSHLLVILEWEDGRILPVSIYTPRWFAPDGVLDDGIVATLLKQQIDGAVQQVVERGLDGCHEHMSESHGGTAEFEAFVALVRGAIESAPLDRQPYLHKWLNLCKSLVRPPIAPEIQMKIDAVKKRLGADQPRGGWDE